MCLSLKHLNHLDYSNEEEYRAGKISYETYIRMSDIAMRCRQCELLDNGKHGDILDECRTRFLRLFVSMKHDAEKQIRHKRDQAEATRAGPDATVILAVAETGS